MEIWATDSAVLGGDGEIELQEAGWEPFSVVYVPIVDDGQGEGYFEVFYRRKKEGLQEVEL